MTAFLLHVLVAHVALPHLNEGKDFLFFSKWHLFGGEVRGSVFDLTWDEGQTYLFRDHRHSEKGSDLVTPTLFYLLGANNFERIRQDFLEKIRRDCQCLTVKVHQLSGSLYEHIVLKRPLSLENEFEL